MRKESVLCKYWNNNNQGNIENNKFNGCFGVCFNNEVMCNWCLIVGMGGYVQATPRVDKRLDTPPTCSFQTIQEVFDLNLVLNNTSFGNRRTVAGASLASNRLTPINF